MLSHVLTNESSSRIFSYINLNGFLSPLSRKNLFKLQDKFVVSSMEKYPTAPGVDQPIKVEREPEQPLKLTMLTLETT